VSEAENPAAAPGPAPAAGPAASPPPDAAPVRPAGGTPAWVPAAVVAGAVLLVEGFIVRQIQPGAGEEGVKFIGDLSLVSLVLGSLSLAAGYFAYLAARVALAEAFEALVGTAVTVTLYGVGWRVLYALLTGSSTELFFVSADWPGKAPVAAGLVGLLLSVAGFAACFRWTASIVWPYFRAGVALNVLAMLHLVVLLLGTVSALNLRFTPRLLGSGIDLTETGSGR